MRKLFPNRIRSIVTKVPKYGLPNHIEALPGVTGNRGIMLFISVKNEGNKDKFGEQGT